MNPARAFRTLLALAGGYVVALALTAAVFVGVGLLQADPYAEPGAFWRVLMTLFAVVARIAGGYTGAWIAGDREIRHGLYVGGLTALMEIAWGNVTYGDNDPFVFKIVLIAAALPAGYAGGWLRARKRKRYSGC